MSIIGTMLKYICKVLSLSLWELKPSWAQIEYFNPDWKDRIQLMSQYIGKTDSVVDLGCGQMWLKEFISSTNHYTGVDYRKRDIETIVCDFNKHQFPNIKADVYFVSGCLEYVADYECFVENIAANCTRCVISYCCIEDFSEIKHRIQRAWVNNLKKSELIEVFMSNGMCLKCEEKTLTNNSIFIFDKYYDDNKK